MFIVGCIEYACTDGRLQHVHDLAGYSTSVAAINAILHQSIKLVPAYKAPVLTDENGPLYFQTQKYTMPNTTKPASALELKKVEDVKCFACHKTPDMAHKERTGRFHH
jgi:hypothetical protein